MAIGKASDFKIYEDQFFGGWTEVQMQNANVFNAASRGAVVMRAATHRGNYQYESFMKEIASLVTRRDTTSVSAATDLAMTQGELIRPKLSRKIGPVAQTLDAWRKMRQSGDYSAEQFSFILGQQAAQAVLVEAVNTALGAVAFALKGQANLFIDMATTDKLLQVGGGTDSGMIQLNSKLGDSAAGIVCYVMHSKPFYDLVKDAVANYKIDTVAGMTLVTGDLAATLGRPIIVTDSSNLTLANQGSTTNKTGYLTLALQAGAVEVIESEEYVLESDVVTGLENLVGRLQGEYAYTVGLRGMQWDVANGGANPANATLITSTNWDKVATDDKSLPGAAIMTL